MDLYIIVLTNEKLSVKLAVHDKDEESAKSQATEKYTGWKVIFCKLDNTPTAIRLKMGRKDTINFQPAIPGN